MYPVLVRLHLPFVGIMEVQTYGVAAAAALVVGWSLARRRLVAAGIEPVHTYWSAVFLLPTMTIGAKLLPLVQNPAYRHFVVEGVRDHGWTTLFVGLNLPGGSMFSAALTGGAAALIYARFYRLPMAVCFDAISPGLALAIPIMRLGCLGAGCCYGTPTAMPWGVVYTNVDVVARSGVVLGSAVHPTQIYEAAAVLVLAAVLINRKPRRERTGENAVLLVGGYAGIRFVMEFFRGDVLFGPYLGPLTITQVVAAGLVAVALAWWFRRDLSS